MSNDVNSMQGMFQFDQFRYAMINSDIPAHIRGMLALHLLNNVWFGNSLCFEEANLPHKELPDFIYRNTNSEDYARTVFQMYVVLEWLEEWVEANTAAIPQEVWEAVMIGLAKPIVGEPATPLMRRTEHGFGGVVMRMAITSQQQHKVAVRWFKVLRSISQNKTMTEFTQRQATALLSTLIRSNPTLTDIAAKIITGAFGVDAE